MGDSVLGFELGCDHPMLVGGEWITTGEWDEVVSPYDGDGRLVGRVARAGERSVKEAVRAAHEAWSAGGLRQDLRVRILERAARMLRRRSDEFAAAIALEVGKPMRTARAEVARAVDTLGFSAAEARKLTGDMVPLEATEQGAGKVGFLMRLPIGVVGAITPFNFPINLVAHKLGPVIAAGNAVVVKPAEQAPITAIMLAGLLLDAGLPAEWLSVVPGDGEVGAALVACDEVKAVTFTGSTEVGWRIRAAAPRKRVLLELGGSAPLIVNDDGDWSAAADSVAVAGFGFAGQSCVSVQRILVHEHVHDAFVERMLDKVNGLVVGDPLGEETDVGPVIDSAARKRLAEWIGEAAGAGGEILAGGDVTPDGLLRPTVIREPPLDSRIVCREAFGPVVTVHEFADFEEALVLANDSPFGLQAGVFTRDIGCALAAARRLEFGGVLINEAPTWRVDQMPYGGVKDSGNAREGPAYAIRELSEERLVTLQG